jgi:hypothetical protein
MADVDVLQVTGYSSLHPDHGTEADIRDIHGPVLPSGPLPFALTGVVLLMALVLLLLRRRLSHPLVDRQTDLSSDALAPQDALAELLAAYQQSSQDGVRIVLDLDAMLRKTLAHHTDIPALRLTAGELQGYLADRLESGDHVRAARLLSLIDQVKFAGHVPGRDETEAALEAATGLLQALKNISTT